MIGYDKLVADGFSPGVAKPFVVLVEHNQSPTLLAKIVSTVGQTPGIAGAVAPTQWRKDDTALVEVFPRRRSAAPAAGQTISSRLKHDVLPPIETQAGGETRLTLGGSAPEDRDFSMPSTASSPMPCCS